MKRSIPFLAWAMALIAAGVALIRMGRIPGFVVDWSDVGAWLATSPIDLTLAALGRLVALALVAWIFFTTVVYVIGRIAGFDPSSIQWLSIGPVRRAADALLAGSIVLSTLTPTVAVATEFDPPPATISATDPAYVPFPAGDGAFTPSTTTPESSETPPLPAANVETETREDTITVQPGDHLWGLAAQHLATHLQRHPSDAEIAVHWRAVVEANTSHLPSGDPDLIYPGDRVVLPPVADGPASNSGN